MRVKLTFFSVYIDKKRENSTPFEQKGKLKPTFRNIKDKIKTALL